MWTRARPDRLPLGPAALRLDLPQTWKAALDGVEAVHLSFYPDLALPGAAETVAAFVDRAAARGVRRLLLLSGSGEPQVSEETVRGFGLAWTVVRPSCFNRGPGATVTAWTR